MVLHQIPFEGVTLVSEMANRLSADSELSEGLVSSPMLHPVDRHELFESIKGHSVPLIAGHKARNMLYEVIHVGKRSS